MDSITQKSNTWTRHILIYGAIWHHFSICNDFETRHLVCNTRRVMLFQWISTKLINGYIFFGVRLLEDTTAYYNNDQYFDILSLQWCKYVLVISIQTWAIMSSGNNSSDCFPNFIEQYTSVIHHGHCPLSKELTGVIIYINETICSHLTWQPLSPVIITHIKQQSKL